MQNDRINGYLLNAGTALLVLLYVYAAAAKLADMALYRAQLYNQSFSHQLADLLLYVVPLLELLAAALLLFRATLRAGLLLSLVLLSAFTGYICLVLLGWWNKVPCSCGGMLSGMSWPGHLAFNLAFISLNLITIYIRNRRQPG